MSAHLAPDDAFLLAASRVGHDDGTLARVLAAASRVEDWGYVVEAALANAVAPLVHRSLELAGEAPVPTVARCELAELHAGSARKWATLERALAEVVDELTAASVPMVGLKDVWLGTAVYGDPGLRPMGDVDLLVRPGDVERARACLGRLGFVPVPGHDIPYARRYAVGQHHRRDSDGVWIDLQTNVAQREWDVVGEGTFTFDAVGLWERARPASIAGRTVLAPSLEDMLFHLALHLEGHRYGELILLCDIAELLRVHGQEVSWPELVRLARDSSSESSVYWVLRTVERLLGVAAPAPVLRELGRGWFPGSLHEPLFGNLGSLHGALDDVRAAADPPPGVLDRMEAVARGQAARAMHLDRELSGLAQRFAALARGPIVLGGEPSPRRFPDPALPAFGALSAFVLDADRPALEAALADCGFERADADGYRRALAIESRDPAIAGSRLGLEIEVRLVAAPPAPAGEGPATNRDAARLLLRARGRSATWDDGTAAVSLTVHVLPACDLVATCAARVGRAEHEQLFEALALAAALERLPGFEHHGLGAAFETCAAPEAARRGLAIAALLATVEPAGVGGSRAQSCPRLFAFARYGPGDLERYPGLRNAFLLAHAWLVTPGALGRLRYGARAVALPRAGVPVGLARLAEVAGSLRGGARRRLTLRDTAYWFEAEGRP